ncbi:MAG TPA: hypothetical protein VKR06_18425, partial [Ktedonosporobacter sp.]|nr:hypothetical protein [Ktedonosporobacter sp.]
MLVDVLTAAASWSSERGERQLLTYSVPATLEAELCVGQLVAAPYGERLVEGLIWHIHPDESSETETTSVDDEMLRDIRTILDPEPALLPHQIALAEWLAEYYVTPLALVAQMMLPPGLLQRSRSILRLAEQGEGSEEAALEGASLPIRALIGLLLTEGELDIEQLKKMLGPKRAREVLKEARASSLIEQDAQLEAPRARLRIKRVVRLLAQGEALLEWRERVEARVQQGHTEMTSLPANALYEVAVGKKGHTTHKGRVTFDPWVLPTVSTTLAPPDKESLIAQHQLAAIDLLLQSATMHSPWTPGALCKAGGLTAAQLQHLVREHIIVIEEAEVRRDPLQGRAIPASTPLQLTPDQQQALQRILTVGTEGRPQGSPGSVRSSLVDVSSDRET